MSYKAPHNAIKESFLPFYKKTNDIGIMLSNMEADQIAYSAMFELDKFFPCKRDFCIFLENWESPRNIVPPTAIYPMEHIYSFKGIVICTSVENLITALRCPKISQIIWYILDIEDLMLYNREEIVSLFSNPNIIKVTVNEDYKTHMKELLQKDINFYHKNNPNFDIEFFDKMVK